MSAAEKLKALEASFTIRPGNFGPNSGLGTLANALPQIVAVVEAAEQRHYEYEPSHRDVPPAWCPVCAALAALDEALS